MSLQAGLIVLWAVGSLLGCWFIRKRSLAYLASTGLAAPGIAYSMVGYGILEFGGILHAMAAGLYALPFHFLFHRKKNGPAGAP
jgi:hypothetical protein